jgi:hypothetical protein
MDQRRLRLGDILDDYCPRERRVTNHAVVAMIEEEVKQTRCTTCDAEHVYKGARVPARRKKETPAALYKEVLAGMPETDEAPLLAVAAAPALASVVPVIASVAPDALVTPDVILAKSAAEPAAPATEDSEPEAPADADQQFSSLDEPVVDGPVHRPLIRATLPRIEGQKDARPVPDFTVRQTPTRGSGGGHSHGHGGFRGDRDRMRMRGGSGGGNGNNTYGHGNGNRPNGGPRFQGNRPPGSGRQPIGRTGGAPSGFRGNGSGNGNGNKRGRGSRG